MVERSQEFFDWLRSIDLLDRYEAALDISCDYGHHDQAHRIKASEYLRELDSKFIDFCNKESESPHVGTFYQDMFKAFQHGREFIKKDVDGDADIENWHDYNLPFSEWFNKYYRE